MERLKNLFKKKEQQQEMKLRYEINGLGHIELQCNEGNGRMNAWECKNLWHFMGHNKYNGEIKNFCGRKRIDYDFFIHGEEEKMKIFLKELKEEYYKEIQRQKEFEKQKNATFYLHYV